MGKGFFAGKPAAFSFFSRSLQLLPLPLSSVTGEQVYAELQYRMPPAPFSLVMKGHSRYPLPEEYDRRQSRWNTFFRSMHTGLLSGLVSMISAM